MFAVREGIQFHKEFSVDELPLKATIDTLRPTTLFSETWSLPLRPNGIKNVFFESTRFYLQDAMKKAWKN